MRPDLGRVASLRHHSVGYRSSAKPRAPAISEKTYGTERYKCRPAPHSSSTRISTLYRPRLRPRNSGYLNHLVIRLASRALAARPHLRSDPDSLADLELGDLVADVCDLADDLVSGYDPVSLQGSPAAGDGVDAVGFPSAGRASIVEHEGVGGEGIAIQRRKAGTN
jgi:hypothetical protein